MEKSKANAIITEFLQKIYGFACKKSFSYDEAEELASEMTAEVYRSLLSQQDICNVEGYIWRICEHTYAKYVSSVKRRAGISIDDLAELPYYDEEDGEDAEEKNRLRTEIAFLSSQRRQIIFRFYYKNESVKSIASRLCLPEGTVKWHLNKARNELKEGLTMTKERKIGSLGIDPVVAGGFGHSGTPGKNGATEYYLGDKLSLNIVYSVYYESKNVAEIAEELGITPVFIEDKIAFLENNGYLVKGKDGRFTTNVCFSPRTYSREQWDNALKKRAEAAEILFREYVPAVRKAMEGVECYIPGGNRQLLEAAAVLYGASSGNAASVSVDLQKYLIRDLDGGEYTASVDLEAECSDPDYEMKFGKDYSVCGSMWRSSEKYPAVCSWSMDSRLDSRKGRWQNNLDPDYEYLYEYLTGKLGDAVTNADKLGRLKEREFIGGDGRVQIMVCKGDSNAFFDRIPKISGNEGFKELNERFAQIALELAMQDAKQYPPRMQDMIVARGSRFFDTTLGMMLLDLLYENGTFRPLDEKERITANLLMFSDVLPE